MQAEPSGVAGEAAAVAVHSVPVQQVAALHLVAAAAVDSARQRRLAVDSAQQRRLAVVSAPAVA